MSDSGMLDEVVRRWSDGQRPGALLGILEEVQEHNKGDYLSESDLRRISELTGTPLSRLYSIATFYSFFNLTPQGEHTIVVCRGTACHTRGSRGLLADAAMRLNASGFNIDEDSAFTTADARITVRTVACFGQCALAPVVSVDGVMYSRMNSTKLASLITRLINAKPAQGGEK
ncbi:MAG: hypothetical protein A2Z99_08640 [Treponema sp. GWB1_62_6]|nr:MAG: hypothetical protein A2Y36_00935 [Treponema sp. GWA1_62_8]OHE66557.1 MAG: hypothetical protein A2001_13245 [Treponema sp. GWC1_61_84]OHE69911.1 MAG: hypothetical protein A2Z99_08640 [Treponema sp. GWB1_62_6]OHE73493.1 MAG: hypothetical protein A2413_18135 [Treponema sp. RIFOXYC1_FULL_61_9]HCM27818.1 NAD(P)H-dependent oxidoreductase subunit E [Treponema sp.]